MRGREDLALAIARLNSVLLRQQHRARRLRGARASESEVYSDRE
jgi:hypothetical protein